MLLSNSSYLSALNSYLQTRLYRQALVSPGTELSSNSSDRELPRDDMSRFKPSIITLVGIQKSTHPENRTPGITLGGLYVTTTPHVTSTRKTRRKKRW